MRILAIRGQNLASLGDPFCLDFQQAPLAHAGLYAITGPTGSGKTTILDAMCLALFDDVPRYQRRGHLRTSEAKQADGLHEGDARNVLRRGAVAAFAEVDFTGRDGYAYRARWSVRRARRKPDGNIQAAELALTRIADGKVLGDQRKNDTKAAIQEKLGLDYAQFLRSVLLAQGDFAAFLQAGEKERAELLERLTGAEIYTQLSKMAFQRYQQAAADLKSLRDQMDQVAVLNDEERAQLDASLQAAEAACKQAQQRQKNLERDAAWFRRGDELKQAIDAAASELDQATAARNALTELAEEVAAVKRATPLQPYWDTLQRHRQHHQDLDNRWTKSLSQLADAEQGLHTAQRRLAAAKKAEDVARETVQALQPDLKAARALDVSITERKSIVEDLTKQLQRLAEDLKGRRETIAGLKEAQQEQAKRLAELDQWFQARASLQPMMAAWAGVRRDLRELSEMQRSQIEDQKRLQRLQTELETVREQVEACGENRQQLDDAVRDAEAVLQRFKHDLAAANQQLTQTDRADLKQQRNVLTTLREALVQWQRRHKTFSEDQHRLAELQSAIRVAQEARDQAHEATLRLEGQVEESERHLAQMQAQVDLADRRSELLQAGVPCPLCGAHEHPFLDDEATPSSDLAHAAQQRLTDVRKQMNEQRQIQIAQATLVQEKQGQAHAVSDALATAAPLLEQAKLALETALTHWQQFLPEEGEAPVFDVEDQEQTTLFAALDEAADALSARENEQEALRRRLDELRTAQDGQQSKLDDLRTQREVVVVKLNGLEKRQVTLATEIQSLQASMASAEMQQQKLLESLAVYQDDDWFDVRLSEDAASFRAQAEELAEAWQAKQDKLTNLKTSVEKAEGELVAKRADLEARNDQYEPLKKQHGLATAALQDLRAQRTDYFDGRDADEEASRLQTELDNAGLEREAASAAERGASDAREKMLASTGEVAQQLVVAQAEVIEARAVWHARLHWDKLEEPMVLALLKKNGAWLREQEAHLKKADDAVRDAQAVAKERRHQLAVHQATSAPEVARDALNAELASHAERLATLEEQRDEHRLAVRQDNERREQYAEWLPKLQRFEAEADRWETMNQLIGSADGTKFRAYAQSLTLETLVQLANEQLQDLEPRYQLQRQPQTDLALVVVDRFMGDEVRSLNSLSGGESFLLSLALALSLSALTAGHTPIESLFIDEGFGTLDGRTLDTALAALESLQASGRSVGVISHVQAMIENIGVRVEVKPTGGGGSFIQVVED